MHQIKNLKKAAERIRKAVKNKENVVIFADADLDGTASAIILEESLKTLGSKKVFSYFPDREKDGYGLSFKALKKIKKYLPAVLILADCGIGNFKEVKEAKKMGFEVLIVEHHEVLKNTLPSASIIVNPKQKGEDVSFRFLACCGVAFSLAKEIFKKKMPKVLEKSFLELAALGTLADLMPKTKENEFLIENGLKSLRATSRPGLKAFFRLFKGEYVSIADLAQKIVSLLQITDSKKNLTESYLLLGSSEEKQALRLLKIIRKKNCLRLELLRNLTKGLEEEAFNDSSLIFFGGGKEIPLSLTGPLATRLCRKIKKPIFVFNSGRNLSRGSVRVREGLNSVKALESCSHFFETYGGHAPASGFTVKNEKIGELKECLVEYFTKLRY